MTSRGEVLLLPDRPAEPARVPEYVSVLVNVLVDGAVSGPLHADAGHDLVAPVAVGVGGAQDIEGGTNQVGGGRGGGGC